MRLSDYEVGQLTDEEIEKRYNIPGYFCSFDKAKLLEKKYTEFRDSAKNMLDLYTDKENKIDNDKANVVSDLLDKAEELEFLTRLAKPTSAPIYNDINDNGGFNTMTTSKFGISGKEYHKDFFDQFKNGFRHAQNFLKESVLTQGGYLLPTEFHDEIIKLLREKNILRQVSSVIQTGNDRDLIIQATAPAAAWISEGQEIDLSDMTFAKKTLKAYKLATAISISNELLQDSFYNLEDFISNEFAEVIGQKEEQAFFNGTGEGQPLGLLPQINADSDTYIQATGVAIVADDLINLETALESSYKQNNACCWIMHPTTLAAVRKLKDGNQQYIWQQAISEKSPTQLLGYPVYTSSNLPTILDNTGEVVVLFGDFSKFIIGQRGNIVFKPLREIKALQDLSVFLMLERVDCILSDKNAVKGLKLQSF